MSEVIPAMVERVREMPTIAEPWPHATLDEFLPAAIFAELVASLPGLSLPRGCGLPAKSSVLPKSVSELLTDLRMLKAFEERFGFTHRTLRLEVAWFGSKGLAAHCDRADKVLSAQVYLAGEAKGTELFDTAGRPAGNIEWKPNRLACWTRPAQSQQHAAPKSTGRFVLLYWFLG